MGEEFYAIIKLVSGEEIVSLVSVDDTGDEPVLIMQNPLVMMFHNNGPHSFIKVKPWMEIPNDDIFIIKLDKIITMTETNDDKIIEIYNRYLIDEKEEPNENFNIRNDGRVKPKSILGYVTSVKDARKKLEELFKLKIEPKES